MRVRAGNARPLRVRTRATPHDDALATVRERAGDGALRARTALMKWPHHRGHAGLEAKAGQPQTRCSSRPANIGFTRRRRGAAPCPPEPSPRDTAAAWAGGTPLRSPVGELSGRREPGRR